MTKIFDKIAHRYDGWYEQDMGRLIHQIQRQLVFKHLDPVKGQKLLDIGCGTGQYSIELARVGLEVTGIDSSEHMLAYAQKKSQELKLNARFIEVDSQEFDYEKSYYDKVICVLALEYFTNPQKVLKKAYSSLKRGGKLVVGVIQANSPWSSFYKEMANNDELSVYKHASFYKPDDLRKKLTWGHFFYEEALYFSPNLEDIDVIHARAIEDAMIGKASANAGFACCVWIKK